MVEELYMSHKLPKTEFIHSLKKFLIKNKIENHYIIGDYNTDLLELNSVSHEFSINFGGWDMFLVSKK